MFRYSGTVKENLHEVYICRIFPIIYFMYCSPVLRWVGVWCYYLRFSYFPGLYAFPDYFDTAVFLGFFTFSLWLTMVVLRSLSLSPPRPDTTLSSRPGGLVRNFPDKLRYRRRAALGEDRLADLRAGAGWWPWSPLMGCIILAVSALEETWVGNRQEGYCGWEKRAEYDIWFSKRTLWSSILNPLQGLSL